ncbi:MULTISPECIES: VOC family protein [unclassified Cupriavidus]|uniref:VOC family protein n=1 Tax=Cupriavidus sp. H19C3 TaxID=3241603 RepID=UPI0011D8A4DE|nr:MAG: VOC family protein [Cupriavidus sp.]
MDVQPYLNFGGRFDEAMAFYGKVLGASVTFLMRFKDTPQGDHPTAPEWADKVMHANVTIGNNQIMASDGMMGEAPAFAGFSMSVSGVPKAEGERIFQALAEGGQVTVPFQKTFWAEGFGMVTDRFGLMWMVNCEQ